MQIQHSCVVCGSVWRVEKLKRIECSRQGRCDVSFNNKLKALHNAGVECYCVVVIETAHIRYLWDRHHGGPPEAGGDYRQKQ